MSNISVLNFAVEFLVFKNSIFLCQKCQLHHLLILKHSFFQDCNMCSKISGLKWKCGEIASKKFLHWSVPFTCCLPFSPSILTLTCPNGLTLAPVYSRWKVTWTPSYDPLLGRNRLGPSSACPVTKNDHFLQHLFFAQCVLWFPKLNVSF